MGMQMHRSISIRITTTALLLYGIMGIPLYQHVCGSVGIPELFSSCTMHEATPETVSCCSHKAAINAPQKIQNSTCCHEIDATKQITDTFNSTAASSLTNGALVFLFNSAVTLVYTPTYSSTLFLSDPSPPRAAVYILHSTFLI